MGTPNGPFQLEHGMNLLHILDGNSNTILVGEKHIPRGGQGRRPWDCSMYNGDRIDCSTRSGGIGFPIANSLDDPSWSFGSDHPSLCQFVMGDGSVRGVNKTIDPHILGLLTNAQDGQPIPAHD